jgi:hypothetical protein
MGSSLPVKTAATLLGGRSGNVNTVVLAWQELNVTRCVTNVHPQELTITGGLRFYLDLN